MHGTKHSHRRSHDTVTDTQRDDSVSDSVSDSERESGVMNGQPTSIMAALAWTWYSLRPVSTVRLRLRLTQGSLSLDSGLRRRLIRLNLIRLRLRLI